MMNSRPTLALLMAGLCVAVTAAAETRPVAIEHEPVLEAAALVQPALLSGPGFSVDTRVELRGYMAHFTLETPYGPMRADSVELLVEREAELPALEALERATHSEAFLRAVGNKFASTGKMLGHLVTHPIDTAIGIPSGVARYLGNRLKKIGAQAQSLSDRTGKRLGNDGNPYPGDDGPMTDARAIDQAEDPSEKPKKHWYTSIGKEIGREAKRQAGYNQAKREIAEWLGIDPYTTNPYIRDRLASLAWAGAGGAFGAGSALNLLGPGAGEVLSHSARINEVVWKLPPEDLRARNDQRLRAHCSDELRVRRFLRRGTLSPTLQTAFADLLDRLQAADGCNALLELGMTASTELEGRFLVNALRLTALHLGPRAKGGTFKPIGAGLAYVTREGELVLPLPVDRLSWTQEVHDFLEREEFRVTDKTVLIGGNASLSARRALVQRGWSIVVRAPWEGAPPYASGEPDTVDLEG